MKVSDLSKLRSNVTASHNNIISSACPQILSGGKATVHLKDIVHVPPNLLYWTG
jgi:hypothetical protein